ncbi:keratin, type I cytoskeletal 19-like [Pelobates fuscus]|uniref:keratin, type I cytoskeletal 19-like n=1 Tax=Pelobates fuscus TaxID=191477 RepID=UPI002FE45A35
MSHSVKQMQSRSVQGGCQISQRSSSVHHHGSFKNVHHGSRHRAPSVHGGSGGKGISLSLHNSSSYGHRSGHAFQAGLKHDGLFSFNEKETMKSLNDRLASYLEKVCSLEKENTQLERNIREWYEQNQPSALPDVSKYYKIIKELQSQIQSAYSENARIFLELDNAKLASDDFRSKYEIELGLSNNISSDVKGLHRVLERLNIERCDFDMQVQSLEEELQQLKNNHEEEVNGLRAQLGLRVSVEVDAAPAIDLNQSLSEIRQQYENLMENNLREVESIFLARTEELSHEVVSGAEQLQSVTVDLIELKRTLQTLEIELQSQWSLKETMEDILVETNARYSSQLSQLQEMINHIESQLAHLRSDLEHQIVEYKILMDQKNHLEMEIATYKRLLEGHDIHVSGQHDKNESNQNVKVQRITQHVQQAKH